VELATTDADLFFKLMWRLQFYVNRQRQILADVASLEDYEDRSMEDKAPVRNALWENLELIEATIEKGSVITVDGGIRTLSMVASQNEDYRKEIFPYLICHLKDCRP